MATNSDWTVVFNDKIIINQSMKDENNNPKAYKIEDDTFWNNSKWSNIWAIQYKDDDHDYNDSVEYRDETPHSTWVDADLGNFRTQFVSRWDSTHLSQLQENWDSDNVDDETESEKIARLGARPTTYSSY